MTMLRQGLNQLRDLFIADIEEGQAGTVGITPEFNQTALLGLVPVTVQSVNKFTADLSAQTRWRLDTGVGTGITYREYGNSSVQGSFIYDRTVFAGVEHTENDELVMNKNYFFDTR